jgi:nicotinate dehydrogenase subunit B
MPEPITLNVNGQTHALEIDPETPLLYALRNDLGLKGPKLGCALEQCKACAVLIDGADVPSCQIPVKQAQGLNITTIEGLGRPDNLHPLQEAFLEEQAAQCGFCTAGMIISAQGLLNRTRYPSDDEIREALDGNLCRCGTHERVRRAIKLRIGRPERGPIYDVIEAPELPLPPVSQDLPSSLKQTPDLDSWIRIHTDGTITVTTGKAELGQGIKTAVMQIAAEELDVAPARIRVISSDTEQTPDEGGTTGSMSVEVSGNAMRYAAAEARHILLELAFEHLESETPVEQLAVVDGTISDPATGRSVTYWELMGGQRFGRQISGAVQPKRADEYQVIGQPEKRVDLPAKVSGGVSYVHDLPDMLHARVVRPPNYHARLISADVEAIRQMPGVIAVVRDGSFLAVVAEREEQAVWAADALRDNAQWEHTKSLPAGTNIYDYLRSQPEQTLRVVNGTSGDEPIPPIEIPADAAQTLNATYLRPFHMHAALGPSAAAVLWEDGKLTVWSHTQAVFNLQVAIAQVLRINPADIHVIHTEGAGCYGHNGADDAGLDAALVARAVPGKPVLLKWSRADEHAWEPYGSAMAMELQASLNADGQVIDWNHDVWSYTHSTRPRGGTPGSDLLAAWHLAQPIKPNERKPGRGTEFGSFRNIEPRYAFPRKRIVKHFVADNPLRTSAMRSLGAYANVFAIESFMDELAHAVGIDPLEFRLNHLEDERAKQVLQAAADKYDWQSGKLEEGRGRGIAFARYKNRSCYAAIIIEVRVDRDSGVIHLERAVIAADAGQVVNPDGLSNQLEGGLIQAASWTLLEQVTFDEQGITSLDWDSYPILRFTNVPVIQTVILNRTGWPFMGSGEATQNPTPAAIANAVYDAVGIRLREIPFTPERIKAALKNLP